MGQVRGRTRSAGADRAESIGGRALTLLVMSLSALSPLLGCGSGGTSGSASNATESTASRQNDERATVGDEIVPPARAADVSGAALAPPTPDVPEDTVALASRMAPRALDIPPTRTGRTNRFVFDGFHRGWFARLPHGQQRLLTPLYGEGKVYLGGGFSSNTVFAYDARSGEREWTASAPDGGPSAAILEDGKVLFNTESCTLFAVDARSGRQLWSRWLGDPLMSQPAAGNGLVFSGHVVDGQSPGEIVPGTTGFGVGDGRRYGFTAMNLNSGAPRWTRPISGDVMNAPVLVGDDVFFTTMDGVVWRLDQRTGRVRWRRRLHATSAPWIDGEELHVSTRVRGEGRAVLERAVVLAKGSGETLTEHEPVPARFVAGRPDPGVQQGWAYEGSRASVVDGRVYQTIGNEVHCRDADTGELLWRRRYSNDVRARPASPPAVAGSQLVFGTEDGTLFGLDIDTGMTAWAYDVGEPISAQPTVGHGWVYAATTRGGLVALEVSDASFDGWHMWGGNAQHNGRVMNTEPPADEDERPSEGTLALGGTARRGEVAGFPLRGTTVTANVSGFVARVRVEQTFQNPYERPVEAIYLFPLPDDAAVDAMEMRAGDRVVRANIRRRHEAQAEYRDARERGVLASLLEQERPNLFRQSVANIRPGDSISVTLTYTQVLPYEEGSYRFVYPMVAGARYQPDTGEGAAEGTEQVVLAPGGERPDRVEVTIAADLGVALTDVSSPTHEVDVARDGDQKVRVTLSEAARPDRDLDVRFQVAGEAPTVAVLSSPPEAARPGEAGQPAQDARAGHFSLALHPRLAVPDDEVMPRELVFVVDTSSSMHGRPIELAKAAMIRALDGLRATDTFRVLSFSDRTSQLSSVALEATPANIARGRRFVSDMQALGATEMVRGVRAALDPEGEDGRMRIVLLMTDGFIGNETEIFREVHERLGQSRLFAFGVGSAVNRYLLTRLSEVGRGDVQVVTLDESPEAAADRFAERIARPYLTDVSIDWGGLRVTDAYPRRLPDVFADRPLVVHARYGAGGRGDVVIRGRVAGRAFEQTVSVALPASGDTRPELESVWARTRIRDLMTAMALQPNAELQEEVTQLGLRHHLLTQWTAFLAIDEAYRAEGEAVTVQQPAQSPAGHVAHEARARRTAAGATYGLGALTQESIGASSFGAPATARPARPMARAPMRQADLLDGFGGGVGGVGRGFGRGDSPPSERPVDVDPSPVEAAEEPRRQTRGHEDCRALALRADGTLDQAVYEACLRRQRAAPASEKGSALEPAPPSLRGRDTTWVWRRED